ncbi:MAG: AAA family ATPase [Chloroflexi bacterium]|nr:AAA family ATPase [Chloroflexota bacterium]
MDQENSQSKDDQNLNHAPVQSLRELIDLVTGRAFHDQMQQEDAGLVDVPPYPFLAFVGQDEMKMALLFAAINPLVNGVLLIGPRGTGKTTIVRSMADLLPEVQRSACFYGCLPEDIETGGIDAVCPDCARKYGEGLPLTRLERAKLIELPLNARLEDVIGGWDERSLAQHSPRTKSGILKQADLNILYIDEVNLLSDEIINAVLDAAAQGMYTVRRGPLSNSYRARFTLIGSMNPEEGNLRPQIMDRFGLRVLARGLSETDERLEAYHRSRAYRQNPRATAAQYAIETEAARAEIPAARNRLPEVSIPDEIERAGVKLVQQLGIDSLRAEIAMFEAARACAAADARTRVSIADLKIAAPMALRLRQSPFMIKYFKEQDEEESRLKKTLSDLFDQQGFA